jgi:hypothetical protein
MINRHAFPAMLRLNAAQFKLIMDSVIWAVKHLERNIADTGLQILYDLINNVQQSDVANEFYKSVKAHTLSSVRATVRADVMLTRSLSLWYCVFFFSGLTSSAFCRTFWVC